MIFLFDPLIELARVRARQLRFDFVLVFQGNFPLKSVRHLFILFTKVCMRQ